MFRSILLAGAAAAAAPSFAAAAVIDFNNPAFTSSSYNYVYGPYKEDGFTLTASRCQASQGKQLCFVTPQGFKSIDTTGKALITQLASTPITITNDAGQAFKFTSIDVSEYWDDLTFGTGTMTAQFSFVFVDGSTATQNRTFNTRGRYPVTTLSFDLKPLKSFSFLPTTGTSGSLQIDNVRVAAVPEPASWAMMIGGFAFIGGALRRRSGALAAA